MRILITGGTGFVGGNLARTLAKIGHSVFITGCQTEQKIEGVKCLGLHFTGINWSALENIDIVFHQAANNDTLDQDAEEMFKANVSAPMTLFEFLHAKGCKKFVYASSTAVYGDSPAPYLEDDTPLNPLNEYAKSKAAFEKEMEAFAPGLETCVGLRYCNIYGPGESHKGHRASMIYKLYLQMSEGKRPVVFRDGNQKRDWCHVDDVVHANVLASHYQGSGVFNVGSGEARSFNDLIKILNVALKTNYDPEYVDNPYEDAYQNYTECDITKARQLLNWQPQYDVASGINAYVAEIKDSPR